MATFWASVGKNWASFYSNTSGHTEWDFRIVTYRGFKCYLSRWSKLRVETGAWAVWAGRQAGSAEYDTRERKHRERNEIAKNLL